jgi:hypothetical protein
VESIGGGHVDNALIGKGGPRYPENYAAMHKRKNY